MSPRSLRSRPPAKPCKGAEVYFVPVAEEGGAFALDADDASELEEEDRVNGLDRALDRRKGLEEAGVGAEGGAGDTTEVCMGGSEGGPTEVGRPPGVRARVSDMPILLCMESASAE